MTDAIVPALPSTQAALVRKYQGLGPTLSQVPVGLSRSLYEYDLQRAMRGVEPLSAPDTQRVLASSLYNTQATPEPVKHKKGLLGTLAGIPGAAISDVRDIVSSVPRLPFALAHEVTQLPQAPAAISQALSSGDIQGLTRAPGVRLIPGAYTVGNIAGGDFNAIAEHPVMTALDVAPAAHELLPNVAQTALGEAATRYASKAKEALLRTGPGLYADMAWGQDSRAVSRMAASEDRTLKAEFEPADVASGDQLTDLARQAHAFGQQYKAIPVERRVELTNLAEQDPKSLNDMILNDDERGFVEGARHLTDTIGRYNLSQGLLSEIDGELYTTDQASRLLAARSARDTAQKMSEVRQMVTGDKPSTPAATPDVLYRGHAEGRVGDFATSSEEVARQYASSRGGDTSTIDRIGINPSTSVLDLSHLPYEATPEQFKQALVDGGVSPDTATWDFGMKGSQPVWRYLDNRYFKNALQEEGVGAIKFQDAFLDAKGGNVAHDSVVALSPDAFGEPAAAPATHATDPAEILSGAKSVIGDNSLTKKNQALLLRGYAHALDSAGYDSSNLMSAIRATEKGKGADWANVQSLLEPAGEGAVLTDTLAPKPILSTNDIIDRIAGPARTDGTVARLAQAVGTGDYSSAYNIARTLAKRSQYTIDGIDDLVDSLQRRKAHSQWLDKTSQFNDKAVAKLATNYDKAIAAAAPDRFQSYVQRQVKNKLLERYSTNPDFDAIARYVEMGYYRGVPGLAGEAADLAKDISATWQDMKANGIDPVFIHRVTPTAAQNLDYPHITDVIRTPTQAKARTADISPYVHDATVAIPHQALELLTKRRTEHFVDSVMAPSEQGGWGVPQSALMEQYIPAAERYAAKNPQVDVLTAAEQLMRKEWEQFDPSSIVTWRGAKVSNFADPIMLPKAVAKNMQLMFHPPATKLTALLDPVMKLYRTSLLPLSPRWHFNNILGNLAMGASEKPGFLAYIGKGRQMVKEGIPEELRDIGVGTGMGQAPKEFVEWDKTTPPVIPRVLDHMDEYHLRAGQTLRRLYDAISEKGGALVKKSYDYNAFWDDASRVAMYLSEKDSALKAGMSAAEAHTAGVALARKVFMKWDEMTPLERSVMRSVFPFYGWTSHVLRYIGHYPFDHPARAAIAGSFARAEVADQRAGLGSKFLSSFFLGHPDENGMIKSVSLSGVNPFRDVANYMTLAGFVGAANPIAQVVFERMGIDPSTGSADLYPDLTYDPNTGRLAAKKAPLGQSLISNFIPQANVVLGMLGASTDWKQLAKTNPEAAGNLLRSQLGLPILFRNVNLYQEEFKSELARHQAQQLALSGALKSGDWSDAERYPGLAPYLNQIQTLQSQGQLKQYTPPPQPSPSELALLNQAVVQRNVP